MNKLKTCQTFLLIYIYSGIWLESTLSLCQQHQSVPFLLFYLNSDNDNDNQLKL